MRWRREPVSLVSRSEAQMSGTPEPGLESLFASLPKARADSGVMTHG